jgi:hypothetical protein
LRATVNWERRWAAYDEPTYRAVLAWVRPEDVVLDIGAGDLRLARRMAAQARRVVAIELNPALLAGGEPRPANLEVVCGDAYRLPFPAGITTGVLLMRHCRRFDRLAGKLAASGCRWLITNARWGLGVERLDLRAPCRPFRSLRLGWYACQCGATGFVPGPPEWLTAEVEAQIHEVTDCPACGGPAGARPRIRAARLSRQADGQ